MSEIAELRHQLSWAHYMIHEYGLVSWTQGNVSARLPDRSGILIKPSGVLPWQLNPENMVNVNNRGEYDRNHGFKPSTDTESHLYIYSQREDINAIVHTHSPYATAVAAHGLAIPCILTEIADEFGGLIPCGGFAAIGGEEIGAAVIRELRAFPRSPAVLLEQHGVFTVGIDIQHAVKAAVLVEEAAIKFLLARQITTSVPALSKEEIEACYMRYLTSYGQRGTQGRRKASEAPSSPVH